MPHVIVQFRPEKSEQHQGRLTEAIARDALKYGEQSVSVSMEEVEPRDWAEKVQKPDIGKNPKKH